MVGKGTERHFKWLKTLILATWQEETNLAMLDEALAGLESCSLQDFMSKVAAPLAWHALL